MRTLLASLFALGLFAATAAAQDNDFNKTVDVGQKAPDFSGIPASTPDGQDASISLGDIKEDVVVVVFLANHCPAVLACEDRINELVDAYKGQSVKVVAIACSGEGTRSQDDLAAIKARAVKDKKFNYTYGWDDTQEIGKAYGAAVTPHWFVLDKDRNIRYMGAMDDSTMNEAKVKKTYVKDAIDALLAGKDVETTATRAEGCGIRYDRK
jgi:peroxiredoxin